MFPTIFQAGSFKLPSFGFLLGIGFFLGVIIGRKRAPKFGITADQFTDASIWAIMLGILGARLVFVVQEWDYYAKNPGELLSQFAGITSFGGIIFGGLGIYLYSRRKKVSFLALLDTAGAAFLVSHAVGRIGCLLNGCCHGRTCDLPWAITVHGIAGKVHPAQVYDSMMNIVAFGLLLWLERRPLKSGQSFAWMLILHGTTRFIYEFWRAGTVAEVDANLASSTRIPGLPITEAQVMAAILIFIGIGLFIARSRRTVEAAE
ncbi:MAG: prolipoprotein diacylglyceryl transferase [Fimbriimonadaceae bacterium]